jgi:hypothetical protein
MLSVLPYVNSLQKLTHSFLPVKLNQTTKTKTKTETVRQVFESTNELNNNAVIVLCASFLPISLVK